MFNNKNISRQTKLTSRLNQNRFPDSQRWHWNKNSDENIYLGNWTNVGLVTTCVIISTQRWHWKKKSDENLYLGNWTNVGLETPCVMISWDTYLEFLLNVNRTLSSSWWFNDLIWYWHEQGQGQRFLALCSVLFRLLTIG